MNKSINLAVLTPVNGSYNFHINFKHEDLKLNSKHLFYSREEKVIPKTHDFIRTQFNRSTQCEFCGKKIWLKDAVQCKDCGMCCHKKCINKCQISTVCTVIKSEEALASGGSGTTVTTQVTLSEPMNDDEDDEEDPRLAAGGTTFTHRSSISGFLAEGLKRVNSANNLAIPGIVPFGQNSRSLPPSPQHSPRRQSLISPTNGDPFTLVTQRLDALPHNMRTLSPEQIASIAEPIIHYSKNEDIMDLAKEASKKLYEDLESDTKVMKINLLVSLCIFKIMIEANIFGLCKIFLFVFILESFSSIMEKVFRKIEIQSCRLHSNLLTLKYIKG